MARQKKSPIFVAKNIKSLSVNCSLDSNDGQTEPPIEQIETSDNQINTSNEQIEIPIEQIITTKNIDEINEMLDLCNSTDIQNTVLSHLEKIKLLESEIETLKKRNIEIEMDNNKKEQLLYTIDQKINTIYNKTIILAKKHKNLINI